MRKITSFILVFLTLIIGIALAVSGFCDIAKRSGYDETVGYFVSSEPRENGYLLVYEFYLGDRIYTVDVKSNAVPERWSEITVYYRLETPEDAFAVGQDSAPLKFFCGFLFIAVAAVFILNASRL